MKNNPTSLFVASLLMLAACGSNTTEFRAQDGTVTATVNNTTKQWSITNADGSEPVAQYDSMRVVEVSESGHPMTVVYHKGNVSHWLQYYSTMQKRSEGQTIGEQREGRWVFYHPNGNIQSESNFVGGNPDGPYRVYRSNGTPYYIGQHKQGIPVGTWEFYDNEGNLAGTKVYDNEGNLIATTENP